MDKKLAVRIFKGGRFLFKRRAFKRAEKKEGWSFGILKKGVVKGGEEVSWQVVREERKELKSNFRVGKR